MIKNIKPKLTWMHPHFCYWTGGTKFILEVIGQLSKKYDVTVITEDFNPEVKKVLQKMKVKIVKIAPFSTNRLTYWVALPILLIYEYFKSRNTLCRSNYIISSMFPMNVLANIVSPANHVQFVFEPFAFFHDKKMIEGYPPLVKLLMKTARYFYGNLDIEMTKKSKTLMTVNNGVSKWIKKIYGREATPSFLIVDTKRFKNIFDKKLQSKYAGRKIVLHTTDYTPLKRSSFIIKNFRKIVDVIPNALLLVTTPRNVPDSKIAHEELAKKMGIGNNFEIVGCVPNEDLPKYYSLADCAVYPGVGSGASACSYFVLEVMSCETPVVRTSDSVEEVVDGESGYLFDPNKPQDMVNGIIKILKNNKLAERMGKNARQRINSVYTTKRVADNFNFVLKSVK